MPTVGALRASSKRITTAVRNGLDSASTLIGPSVPFSASCSRSEKRRSDTTRRLGGRSDCEFVGPLRSTRTRKSRPCAADRKRAADLERGYVAYLALRSLAGNGQSRTSEIPSVPSVPREGSHEKRGNSRAVGQRP